MSEKIYDQREDRLAVTGWDIAKGADFSCSAIFRAGMQGVDLPEGVEQLGCIHVVGDTTSRDPPFLITGARFFVMTTAGVFEVVDGVGYPLLPVVPA